LDRFFFLTKLVGEGEEDDNFFKDDDLGDPALSFSLSLFFVLTLFWFLLNERDRFTFFSFGTVTSSSARASLGRSLGQ